MRGVNLIAIGTVLVTCASGFPALAGSAAADPISFPLQCVPSVALTVRIDDSVRFPEPKVGLERRLLAAAAKALGERGVKIDPGGRDLHLDVIAELDELFAVLSPRGESGFGARDEADWLIQRSIRAQYEDAVTVSDVEDSISDVLAEAFGLEESCRPTRYSSAHDRFVFELPPIDPGSRSRYLRAVHGEEEGDYGALFERLKDGHDALRSRFKFDSNTVRNKFFVTDDGRFLVAYDIWLWMGLGNGDALVLLRSDGTEIRRLSREDLLTPGDLEQMQRTGPHLGEPTLDDALDRLTFTLSIGDRLRTVEIDLATGEPIVPKRDLVPYLGAVSGVYAPRAELATAIYRTGTWSDPVCVGEPVDFAAADLVRESPGRFYGRSVARPLPEYTELAKRARLVGTVDVEVVVAATGEVICARVTHLPMGLSKAVESVATRWRFRPAFRDGLPVRSIGRFSIHFGTIDPLGEF